MTRLNLAGGCLDRDEVWGHSLGYVNIFPEDPGELTIRTVREVFALGEEGWWAECGMTELSSEGDKWLFDLETLASFMTWMRVLSVTT